MALEAGTRVGPYEIIALLGAGGMGEVYKASDTRLNRTVAIKVLPEHWADDPAMKERFDREAQAVASLTHSNICTLHDIGREIPSAGRLVPTPPQTGTTPVSEGKPPSPGVTEGQSPAPIDFLVMEYLEGKTLAQRLERGALPLDEAIKITIGITDALDKAHREGIVHRDLKPQNVMLTSSGPKLLDFGLSKFKPPEKPASATPPSMGLPRLARKDATGPGMIVDITPYMAPEQVSGAEADARSDIFSLGAILHEMVTGTKAFEGKNRALLIAAIATLELDPLSKSQPAASPALDHLAKRCLAKDPDDRWQTAHDLALQLRWVLDCGVSTTQPSPARVSTTHLALGLAAALVVITGMTLVARMYWQTPQELELLQFRVPVAGLSDADIALSPDGQAIALVARPSTQEPASLYIRPVGSTTFRKLGGTEDATLPFWSPDSRTVAFAAGGRLKRVDAAGGAPKDIGEAPGFQGGTWNRDGVMVFGSAKGLYRVSAEGGKPEPMTAVEKGETGHYWPSFLPDGRHYTYLAWSAEPANRGAFLGSLESKDRTRLMSADSNIVYAAASGSGDAAAGYLVFHREATLFAQPFDATSRTLGGEPIFLADQLAFSGASGRGHFDVSQNGVLLFVQGGGGGATSSRAQTGTNWVFGWRDQGGKQLGMAGEQGTYGDIDLSPDGKFIAITRQDAAPGSDIWVIDWERAGVPTRLTLDPADDMNPVWSPAGDRIAFTTFRKGNADVYIKNANGVGAETPLLESSANEAVEDWSKDGKYIAFKLGQDAFEDLYVLPLTGDDKKPIPVVTGPFRKDEPQFSYDGKWLAYTSNESGGTFEVYVISFPAGDQKLRVSAIGGGGQPRWRRDGRELYYRAPDDGVMVVEIKPGPRIEAGIPRRLFSAWSSPTSRDPIRHMWDVTADGQRFLLRYPNGSGAALQGRQGAATTLPYNFQGSPGVASGAAAQGQAFVSSGLTVIRNWSLRGQQK